MKFMYFGSTDGGMEVDEYCSREEATNGVSYLYGWMSAGCKTGDAALLDFIKTAEVGDVYSHRLGYMVGIK